MFFAQWSRNDTAVVNFLPMRPVSGERLILIQSYFPRLFAVLHEAEAATAAQQE
jgi:hypothetical protein